MENSLSLNMPTLPPTLTPTLTLKLLLPSSWFWGIKIKRLDDQSCVIQLPYSWRTKNPFKSIYFAAQAGAAELSTGLLMRRAMAGKPPISMLVVGFQMEFLKKADEKIFFTCAQGDEIQAAIGQLETGHALSLTLPLVSEGRNAAGVVVSRAVITWSMKPRRTVIAG